MAPKFQNLATIATPALEVSFWFSMAPTTLFLLSSLTAGFEVESSCLLTGGNVVLVVTVGGPSAGTVSDNGAGDGIAGISVGEDNNGTVAVGIDAELVGAVKGD